MTKGSEDEGRLTFSFRVRVRVRIRLLFRFRVTVKDASPYLLGGGALRGGG